MGDIFPPFVADLWLVPQLLDTGRLELDYCGPLTTQSSWTGPKAPYAGSLLHGAHTLHTL